MTENDQKQLSPLCPADFSDSANAAKFCERAKGKILWTDSLGWLSWDGKVWQQDKHKVTEAAIQFAQDMLEDAVQIYRDSLTVEDGKTSVPTRVERYLKHAERTRNRNGIENFLELSKAYLHIEACNLDSRWWELNTVSGIVDLRTGTITPHNPEALHTKICPFSPGDDGAEEWKSFLELVFSGDQDLIRYKQMRTGLAAYGKVHEESLEIDVGGGKNGKSTLNNAIFKVFGDYATAIDSAILTLDRQQKGASFASLRGVRFATAAELEENARLSVSTLKALCSTDALVIEKKYHDPEVIQPCHSIVLFSNYLPKVASNDNGTWRRIRVIPFNAVMPTGDKQILNYADKLVERCGSSILKWIISGAEMAFKAGFRLEQPQAVLDAVDKYRREEDWLQNFIADRCLIDKANARTGASDLYGEYRAYSAANNEYCRSRGDFSRAMAAAGFRKINVHNRQHYVGIRVSLYRGDYINPPAVGQ